MPMDSPQKQVPSSRANNAGFLNLFSPVGKQMVSVDAATYLHVRTYFPRRYAKCRCAKREGRNFALPALFVILFATARTRIVYSIEL